MTFTATEWRDAKNRFVLSPRADGRFDLWDESKKVGKQHVEAFDTQDAAAVAAERIVTSERPIAE